MMKFLLIAYIFVHAMNYCDAESVKNHTLIDAITICKRNDPELSNCFCTNFNNIVPILKDGLPQMNIIPIDPFVVESVKLDFLKSQSVKLAGNLRNATFYGFSTIRIKTCSVFNTSDGIQLYFEMHCPEVVLQSVYKAMGNFLMMNINATGDFHAELTNVKMDAVFNSTVYVKDKMEYLKYSGEIIDVTMEKVAIYFSNVFGNNTKLNEDINHMINENISTLFDEIKPVILEACQEIFQENLNDFHATFPYDLLYPTE